jgi:NIPSNAP
MTVYEMRTYTLHVGKMAEAVKLYTQFGYPALQKGGHDKKLIGYFQADTGMMNQLVHLWKFDDDADRRAHSVQLNKRTKTAVGGWFRLWPV